MHSLPIAALSVALLAGCSTGTGTMGAPIPAQITTDLQGGLTALSTLESLILATNPKAISTADQATINAVLADAQSALSTVSATTPAASGASTLSTIDGYLNAGVGILAKVADNVPGLSNFAPEINAVDALLPTVEAFVNPFLAAAPATVSVTASLSPVDAAIARYKGRAHSGKFTPAEARMKLRIPVKSTP